MSRLKTFSWVVIGCGALVAATIACAGGASSSSGGAPSGGSGGSTAAPAATEASSSGSDPLENMDPCSIVTQDDATAFFGAPSVAGMPSKGDPAFCVYSTADNAEHLSFNIRYVASGAVTSDDFVLGQGTSQDVPGLGDKAYFNATMSMLSVARGPWSFRVSGNLKDGNPTLDQVTTVAKTALGRLL